MRSQNNAYFMRKPAPLPKLLLFSQGEQRGVFGLSLLCLCFLVLPSFTANWLAEKPTDFTEFQQEIRAFQQYAGHPNLAVSARAVELFSFDPNRATADDFVRLGLSLRIANQICNYREKGGQFLKPDDFQKIYGLSVADFERLRPYISIEGKENAWVDFSKKEQKRPAENFKFDPNTASFQDLQRLGLSDRTAQSILNYRSKGGVFRKAADFSKIFTLAAEDFERLQPYIELPDKPANAPTSAIPQTYSTEQKPSNYPNFGKPKIPAAKIDINKSDAMGWKTLPGIGEFFSQKIVNFRDKLGGFYKIEQVAETRGLPDSTFQKIRPFLVLESPVFRKININTATVEDFKSHPYFDRRLSEAIIAYRESHGAFKKLAELRAVKAIRKDWFELIDPYLTVE